MNYDNMSNEELQLQISANDVSIKFTTERIERWKLENDDLASSNRQMQTVIDNREIKEISDAEFPEQVKYFLRTMGENRSFNHAHKAAKFFDILSVQVFGNTKEVWLADFDAEFIKTHFPVIKMYLPLLFDFVKDSWLMETILIKNIKVKGNKMVERICYYPTNGSFRTEGVYLRGFNNIDDLLFHMTETNN